MVVVVDVVVVDVVVVDVDVVVDEDAADVVVAAVDAVVDEDVDESFPPQAASSSAMAATIVIVRFKVPPGVAVGGEDTGNPPAAPRTGTHHADGPHHAARSCPGRDSNPHAPEGTAEFKSAAATDFATRARPEGYSAAPRPLPSRRC